RLRENILCLHQSSALTFTCSTLGWRASTAERVGFNQQLPVRSRLGDSSGEAIRQTLGPEKTTTICEDSVGSGTAKEVSGSGAVTVHASTRLAPSQEPAARA